STYGSPYPYQVALARTAQPTTTTLSASPSGTVTQGTPVTLTATVSPSTPGTVQFLDGGNPLGPPVAVDVNTPSAPTTPLRSAPPPSRLHGVRRHLDRFHLNRGAAARQRRGARGGPGHREDRHRCRDHDAVQHHRPSAPGRLHQQRRSSHQADHDGHRRGPDL